MIVKDHEHSHGRMSLMDRAPLHSCVWCVTTSLNELKTRSCLHRDVSHTNHSLHVGHVRFVYICVTPVVLTPNRCEIPRCHGCACDLLVRVRDLCVQATNSL